MPTLERPVVIVGGGVGGLSLARSLAIQSIDSCVYERKISSAAGGAGLGLGSNGVLALRYLGIPLEGSKEVSEIDTIDIQNQRGRRLKRLDLRPIHEVVGAPSICLPRTTLLTALARADPHSRVRGGHEVVGLRREPQGWGVTLSDASEVTSPLVVGADGVHSIVREQLGPSPPPRYQGYTAWQALVPGEPSQEATSELAVGDSSEFGYAPAGKGRLYWYATVTCPEAVTRDHDDPRRFLLNAFRNWSGPAKTLLRSTQPEHIVRTPIHYFPPIARWSGPGLTLLGDAAHPITPHLGQGASLALEDSVVLGRLMRGTTDLKLAIAAYEAARHRRTTVIGRESAQLGRILHWTGTVGRLLASAGIALTPRFQYLRRIRNTMAYDPASVHLNVPPSPRATRENRRTDP